jgi:hypothetical protein
MTHSLNNFIDKEENNNIYSLSKSPIIFNKDKLHNKPHNNDNIYLITQFFIHPNKERYEEIVYCLKENIKLNKFKKIYLVNEKLYTKEELMLNNEEFKNIKQIVYNGDRMTYKHAFNLVKEHNLKGYIIITNSDIFFDITLKNIHRTSLSQEKAFYTQLRFEFVGEKRLANCKIFGPRPDSQDTWIYHTNFQPNKDLINNCDFMLGKPGCDNSIIYHLCMSNYIIYNEPYNIKTYHYHKTQIRNYNRSDLINPPYMRVMPNITF